MSNIFIHSTSLVETHQIGCGTQIWAFAQVLKGVTIGAQCNIGDHCLIETGVTIDDNVVINHGNQVWSGVMLDNGRFVGPIQQAAPKRHPAPHVIQAQANDNNQQKPVITRIREGAIIRSGAVVLAGTQIGKFAIVGVRAVVTQDVPAYALVVGNPARIQGWVCQCGQPLKFYRQYAQCEMCNLSYTKDQKTVKLVTF